MNVVFSHSALTDKQMNYIELYYADDYSLAEIAEEFGVSRQAVYDNIKRTEKNFEDYEMKLHIFRDYIVRSQIFDQILERWTGRYLQWAGWNFIVTDNREWLWAVPSFTQGIPLKTISSRRSISYLTTDYSPNDIPKLCK